MSENKRKWPWQDRPICQWNHLCLQVRSSGENKEIMTRRKKVQQYKQHHTTVVQKLSDIERNTHLAVEVRIIHLTFLHNVCTSCTSIYMWGTSVSEVSHRVQWGNLFFSPCTRHVSMYLCPGIVIHSFVLSFCPTGYYFLLVSSGITRDLLTHATEMW